MNVKILKFKNNGFRKDFLVIKYFALECAFIVLQCELVLKSDQKLVSKLSGKCEQPKGLFKCIFPAFVISPDSLCATGEMTSAIRTPLVRGKKETGLIPHLFQS